MFIPNQPAYDTYNEFPFDDVHLTWYLADVAPIMPQIRAYSSQLHQNIPTYARVFRKAFPDFKQTKAVYFMPSLFIFDGQTNDTGIRFGIDGIVKYDEQDENLGILVDHELFHFYHDQAQTSVGANWTGAFWESVWQEGMATYVSYRLNPGSTEAEVLHSKALAALSPNDVSKLACDMSSVLDKNRDMGNQFLDGGGNGPDGLPSRGAYLIGFMIAKKIGQTTPDLRQLARLHGDDLHSAITTNVATICGQPTTGDGK